MTGSTVVTMHSITGPDTTLEDAVGTASTCPGVTLPAADVSSVYYTTSVPFFARWDHPWALPTLAPELVSGADFSTSITVLSTVFESMFPFFGPEQTALAVQVEPEGSGAGACSAISDVAVSVTGQTGASVFYYDDSLVPQILATATSTSANGLAVVLGLPDGARVQVTGYKQGCTVLGSFDQLTGHALLQKGVISQARLRVSQ